MGQAAAHAIDLAGRGSLHEVRGAAIAERVRANLDGFASDDPWCKSST